MLGRNLYISFSATKKFEECDFYFKNLIRRAISATLDAEEFDLPAEVSVTLCDNEYIRKLNCKYRNKDSATDVLSFPLYDFSEECEPLLEGEPVVLGDIVISLERAREQARELGNSFLHEVAFLTVHSVLHLLGYDHERSPEDDEEQCARQREIIKTIEI